LGLSRFADKEKLSTPINYYALDLEKRELERTLGEIDTSPIGEQLSGKVATKGLCGTYDDGLKFLANGGLMHDNFPSTLNATTLSADLQDTIPSPISSGSESSEGETLSDAESSVPSSPEGAQRALHIMFLGSSIGNFGRDEAASFLRSLPLRAGEGDTLLLGLDHDNEKEKIEEAYNDKAGYTKRFIMNGLRAAGRTLGDESLFDEENWDYVNEYNPVGDPSTVFPTCLTCISG